MKWLRRILIAIVLLVAAVATVAHLSALRSERPVGFQVVRALDASDRPFAVGVWYPTEARPWPTSQMGAVLMNVARDAAVAGDSLPLVVISHGNGGGPSSHADLAMALASAGYVVAAPMHLGDNFADQAGVGSAMLFHDRVRQLRATPEFACEVLRAAGSPLVAADGALVMEPFVADARIGAAVVAAPGLGFTMDSASLAGIRVPIQLWSGEADTLVPDATNAKRIREAMGAAVESHLVPGAGHFSFLTPCGLLRPPGLCTDAEGFDRKAFHARMNAGVVAFFDGRLRVGR